MKRIAILPLSLLLLTATLSLSGCNSLREWFGGEDDEHDRIAYVVSLYQIVSGPLDRSRLVRQIDRNDSGDKLWIRTLPLFTSIDATAIEARGNGDGTITLVMYLTPHSRMVWSQIRADQSGRYVAVVVDGEYRFQWRMPRPGVSPDNVILLRGPWEPGEAALIAEWAPYNHEHVKKD